MCQAERRDERRGGVTRGRGMWLSRRTGYMTGSEAVCTPRCESHSSETVSMARNLVPVSYDVSLCVILSMVHPGRLGEVDRSANSERCGSSQERWTIKFKDSFATDSIQLPNDIPHRFVSLSLSLYTTGFLSCPSNPDHSRDCQQQRMESIHWC